jgi:DNA-directed RNA polymerase subunit M/transcription elongation factor TFIIS
MRLPWQPSEYVRTCTECGHSWQVPRWAARRRVGAISGRRVTYRGMNLDRAAVQSQVDAIEARNQQADTFRVCPHCGAETFTQRRGPSKSADSSSRRA